MPTKTFLIDLINSSIRNKVPKIIPSEHSDLEAAIVEAIFIPYEVKELDCPKQFIADNFDNTGLGINLMVGFAICNGKNGTKPRGGRISIGYDPTNYAVIGETGGAKEFTIAANNIPKLDITVPVSNAGGGGAPYTNIVASGSGTPDKYTYNGVIGNTTPAPISNLQPHVITLFVQRI